MKIYISGAITSDPGFKAKFGRVARTLTLQGHAVFNPATLPAGLTYDEYMSIDLAMVGVADAIYMLPCWKDSPGANRELKFARELDKVIIFAPVPVEDKKYIMAPQITNVLKDRPFNLYRRGVPA